MFSKILLNQGLRAVVRWIDLIHERVLSMTCRPGGPARENVTLASVEKARVWGARDGQFYRVSGFIDRSEVPHQISEDPNVIHEFHCVLFSANRSLRY